MNINPSEDGVGNGLGKERGWGGLPRQIQSHEIVKVSPDCLQSHEMNKVSNSVRKSIKPDLKGVHRNHIENPFFQMCSYGFLVHPGPPKTLQNQLNRFILWDPGQKPEKKEEQKSPYGGWPVPY